MKKKTNYYQTTKKLLTPPPIKKNSKKVQSSMFFVCFLEFLQFLFQFVHNLPQLFKFFLVETHSRFCGVQSAFWFLFGGRVTTNMNKRSLLPQGTRGVGRSTTQLIQFITVSGSAGGRSGGRGRGGGRRRRRICVRC